MYLDFSGIRTRIVGVVVEHADHWTITTAQVLLLLLLNVPIVCAVAEWHLLDKIQKVQTVQFCTKIERGY